MHQSFTDMRSRLWAHLRSLAPANRHSDLSASDYQQARYVALVERDEFSGAHRHVSLHDVAEYGDARLQDDVAAWLLTGSPEAKDRGWQRLCDALTTAANVCTDNRLRELRGLRMAGARTSEPRECVPYRPRHEDDPHADELAQDARVERAQVNERMRDFVEELAVRA